MSETTSVRESTAHPTAATASPRASTRPGRRRSVVAVLLADRWALPNSRGRWVTAFGARASLPRRPLLSKAKIVERLVQKEIQKIARRAELL